MVHDNIIKSYSVDFDTKTLVIKTVYTNANVTEKADIIFTDYLAHNFDNVMKGSMIFDIYEYCPDILLKHDDKMLKESKNHGWPFGYESDDDFKSFIQTHGYKIFEVFSSIGLSGVIFAKQMTIVVNGVAVGCQGDNDGIDTM